MYNDKDSEFCHCGIFSSLRAFPLLLRAKNERGNPSVQRNFCLWIASCLAMTESHNTTQTISYLSTNASRCQKLYLHDFVLVAILDRLRWRDIYISYHTTSMTTTKLFSRVIYALLGWLLALAVLFGSSSLADNGPKIDIFGYTGWWEDIESWEDITWK